MTAWRTWRTWRRQDEDEGEINGDSTIKITTQTMQISKANDKVL